jgi:hypothetical protein
MRDHEWEYVRKNRATDFHRSPRIRSKNKAPRTKHQEPTRLLIRVPSVFDPWLKGYWKNQPRVLTDLHGFDPTAKRVVDLSVGHS